MYSEADCGSALLSEREKRTLVVITRESYNYSFNISLKEYVVLREQHRSISIRVITLLFASPFDDLFKDQES